MSEKGFLVFRKSQPSVEVCHLFRFQNFLPKNACKLFRPKPELCRPKFYYAQQYPNVSVTHLSLVSSHDERCISHTFNFISLCTTPNKISGDITLVSDDIIRARWLLGDLTGFPCISLNCKLNSCCGLSGRRAHQAWNGDHDQKRHRQSPYSSTNRKPHAQEIQKRSSGGHRRNPCRFGNRATGILYRKGDCTCKGTACKRNGVREIQDGSWWSSYWKLH